MNPDELSEKKSEIVSVMQTVLEARKILVDMHIGKIIYTAPGVHGRGIRETIQKLDDAFNTLSREI